MNGDGNIDLVFWNKKDQFKVLLGSANGTFTP